MTSVLLALLALGAALLQVGAMPVFVFHTAAAPLLPIALLAAWGTVRRPAEVWPALLLVAITLGVASEQRTGWYLLALLPTGALLLAPTGQASAAQSASFGQPVSIGYMARAPLAAAVGAWAYLALLLVAAGDVAALPALSVDLVLAAMGTGALAAALSVALWPLRVRSRGLFT